MKYFVTIFLFLIASQVQATSVSDLPESCGLDIYNAIEAKAELEAMREVEVAQRLILKPDSILEYSCFTLDAQQAGFRLDTYPLYFVGNAPSSRYNVSMGSLDTAISATVVTPSGPYLTNYGHVYLGGTLPSAFTSSVCNPMFEVWNGAKCANFERGYFRQLQDFFVNTAQDPYDPTFWSAKDIRNVPVRCPYSQARVDKMFADLNEMNEFPVRRGNKTQIDSGNVDLINNDPYEQIMRSCGTPINTGLLIENPFMDTVGFTDFERLCITPGCFYDLRSGECRNF